MTTSLVIGSPSGPGVLLQWPVHAGAGSYHVFAARQPSPTFYELQSDCCPLLPTQRRPCCPVDSRATSLQVEGLDAGALYRFRVLADTASGLNDTIGVSAPIRVPSSPAAPGAPTVLSSSDGAVVDLQWRASVDDGGDLIRGYRIWADMPSINESGVVLVANTSAGRPHAAAEEAAALSYMRLPLLPSHRYILTVQAFNAAGAGARSPPTLFDAPMPRAAEYELPLGRWRRGHVTRGGVIHHRTFVPVGCERALLHVQQATRPEASLRERQLVRERTSLHLHLGIGRAPQVSLVGDLDGPMRRATPLGTPLPATPTWRNTSAVEGALSVQLAQTASEWLYALVWAADVSGDGIAYDVLFQAWDGSGTSLQPPPADSGLYVKADGLYVAEDAHDLGTELDTSAARAITTDQGQAVLRARQGELAERWRYLVDPEGPSAAHPNVITRHLHPAS